MNATAEQFKATIPAAVRRQARKAEREHEKVYKPQDGEASPTAMQAALQAAQEAPGTEHQGSEPTPAPSAASDPQVPPEASAPAGAASATPTSQEPPEPPAEDWEQKYRTLQGMIKAKDREIHGLQQTLAAVSSVTAPPTPPASAAPEQGKWSRRLKDDDVQAYGEDMIGVIRAAAHDEFMPVIDKLRAENTELREQLGQVSIASERSAARDAESLLDTEVPNWRQINTDPEFLDWLQQPDMFSGRQRHELLQEAGADGPRVLAFFKAYLNENQAIRGHQEATPAAPQQTQASQQGPIVDKTSLVAPGRPAMQNAGAGAASGAEEPQFFTQKQIATFYREVQQGKWKQRPKEKDKLERAIHKAAMEGRVRA